jgi:hypothetical protein
MHERAPGVCDHSFGFMGLTTTANGKETISVLHESLIRKVFSTRKREKQRQ